MFQMLEMEDVAERLRWDDESPPMRTVILGMIPGYMELVTLYDTELTPEAISMINKTWDELSPHEQGILTKHGIVGN